MHIAKKTVLVTGANRGIGKALVKEALNRGAKRVFAGTRSTLPNSDSRVTALTGGRKRDSGSCSQNRKRIQLSAGLLSLVV